MYYDPQFGPLVAKRSSNGASGCKIPISGIKKGSKRPFKQFRPPREAPLGPLAGSLSIGLSVGREGSGPLSVAPQAGPKISPLGTPQGRRERSLGAATPPPLPMDQKTAFAEQARRARRNASHGATTRRRAGCPLD
jgi:hypothetical protein